MALCLFYRQFIGAAAFLAISVAVRAVRAQAQDETSKGACRQAYESAQLLRRSQKLLGARQQLRICGAEGCPAITRTDCVRWLAEVEVSIPSVVFEARTNAGPVFDVSAKVDGNVLVKEFDGRPVELDPGLHTFVFEQNGNRVIEQKVILREGQKNQLVVADWTTPKPEDAPAPAARLRVDRPVPASVYVATGIAALGFADFAIAGTLGNSLKSDLETSRCAPFCPRDQANALRTRYVIADIGLAIGVAELTTAVVLFLTRPERWTRPSDSTLGARALPLPSLVAASSPSIVLLYWQGRL